jgi:hypothetical protein
MGEKKKKIQSGTILPEKSDVKIQKLIHTPVSVLFRYVQAGDDYCLSHCEQDDVKATAECLRKLTTMTWQEVLSSGGRSGGKVGLGHTDYEDSVLRGVKRPDQLSEDITLSGIRATQKMRIFGAYHKHVYYVLWFDPNHEIVRV